MERKGRRRKCEVDTLPLPLPSREGFPHQFPSPRGGTKGGDLDRIKILPNPPLRKEGGEEGDSFKNGGRDSDPNTLQVDRRWLMTVKLQPYSIV